MRTEALVFIGVATFMGLIGVIYWVASSEPAGTTMLGACMGLAVIPGGFLAYHSGRMRALDPQDDPDADIRDGSGPVGAFAGSSVWPVVLAAGATMSAVGLIFGAWAVVPGLVLMVTGFLGAALESRSPH